jgi:hypothetical protein
MTTIADKNLDEAKEHINQAYKNLLIVIDSDTWGHENFHDLYVDKIEECIIELAKIKRKLK